MVYQSYVDHSQANIPGWTHGAPFTSNTTWYINHILIIHKQTFQDWTHGAPLTSNTTWYINHMLIVHKQTFQDGHMEPRLRQTRHGISIICWSFTSKHSRMDTWSPVYVHYKVWDTMSYSFQNFIGAAIEVWKRLSNFIPHFMGACNYLSMLGSQWIQVNKSFFLYCAAIWFISGKDANKSV